MFLDGSLCNDALWRVLAAHPSSQCCFFRHRYNQVTLTQAGRTPYVHIDTEATGGGLTVYSGRTHREMSKGHYTGEIGTFGHAITKLEEHNCSSSVSNWMWRLYKWENENVGVEPNTNPMFLQLNDWYSESAGWKRWFSSMKQHTDSPMFVHHL